MGRWDFFIDGNFDAVRWTNYFGEGNETVSVTKKNGYHRTITREWLADLGFRTTRKKWQIEVAGFYQRLKIKKDTGSYVAKEFPGNYSNQLLANDYAGIWLAVRYAALNDAIVPTKGLAGILKITTTENFRQHESFQNYTVKLQGYLPLSKKFSIAVRAGGTTIQGKDPFVSSARVYEHAVIGGVNTLRGYRLERFWGKTSFYNNNELRFITNLRSHILNAKAGLIAFFDDGRVWTPFENSDKMHTSYGGGILLAPFNQLCLTLTYGISSETRLVHLQLNKTL
jgi:outer membrane protein assembly factor BamA